MDYTGLAYSGVDPAEPSPVDELLEAINMPTKLADEMPPQAFMSDMDFAGATQIHRPAVADPMGATQVVKNVMDQINTQRQEFIAQQPPAAANNSAFMLGGGAPPGTGPVNPYWGANGDMGLEGPDALFDLPGAPPTNKKRTIHDTAVPQFAVPKQRAPMMSNIPSGAVAPASLMGNPASKPSIPTPTNNMNVLPGVGEDDKPKKKARKPKLTQEERERKKQERLEQRRIKKSAREKRRRNRENQLFEELADLCELPKDNRDKSSILAAVITTIGDTDELSDSDGDDQDDLDDLDDPDPDPTPVPAMPTNSISNNNIAPPAPNNTNNDPSSLLPPGPNDAQHMVVSNMMNNEFDTRAMPPPFSIDNGPQMDIKYEPNLLELPVDPLM